MNGQRQATGNRQRLSDSDKLLMAIWIALALAAIAIVIRYFPSAFPQISIDFRYDRHSSRAIAEKLLRQQRLDAGAMKHAVRFDSDESARIFLERSLGLEEANRVMSEDVHVWAWHHRWFRPLVEEELSVDVAPDGTIVGFTHHIPEDRALPVSKPAPPVGFLRSVGVDVSDLNLILESERRLPHRVQRIFTWESVTVRPAGAAYRYTVTVDGNLVTSYSQQLKVPEAWSRSYSELRSKNYAASSVDLILNIILGIGAVVIFIVQLRRGNLPLRFLLGVGVASVLLSAGVALNQLPSQLAHYDTTTSYAAFVGQVVFHAAVQSVGTAMLLIVICGAGEVLYRRRLPQQLAMPRIWTRQALGSRRVFLALILGYALVPMFIAYQVVFYLTATHFGAWSPAEMPYDDTLNTAFPWIAVLFAGFFPALSEEFLSRAFAIPFLQKFLRSRWLAIVLAAFIWGFGHSAYANQPFWIRGVEVGLAGIVAGLLMERFGLLPLLIWHYTIDAVYTATLLFSSGNTYYIVSAALASLLFAIPLVVSVALYVRNKGFVPDEELANAAMPVFEPPGAAVAEIESAPLPAAPLTRRAIVICILAIAAAAIAIAFRPPSPQDAIDYRITKEQAKEIAIAHIGGRRHAYVIASPVEGFRSWNRESAREEGGAPGGFDGEAATWLVRNGMPMPRLLDIFRHRIEAGTWTVRFFTPLEKEEIFVEVDPRTSRVVGYHKYQDEENPGPSLSQLDATILARREFARYGLDTRQFELREALSFQQPHRRDWLLHFDDRVPLAPDARRRVSVRVAGAEVTQFHKTVKVPESVYRQASTETLLNVVLFVLEIAGIVALLSLVIAGLIVVTRAHGLPWKRALRWAAVLAVIPIARFAAHAEEMLFGYSTSIAWETFQVGLLTSFIRDVGLQTGLLFLALAGLEAALPYARKLGTREGRARFGRSAVVAALTAVALLAVMKTGLQFLDRDVSIAAPAEVATPLPALVEGSQALLGAIIVSAAIALYATALQKHVALITTAAIFFASLDAGAMPSEVPLMLLRAAIVAGVTWIVARYVLDANPLAWPLAIFLTLTLQTAAMLAQNHRPDLLANAIGLVAIALAALAWIMRLR